MQRRRSNAGVAALGACALLAAAAHAGDARAAVTIGTNLSHSSELLGRCADADGCAWVQEAAPGARLKSPIDGVIVRWRVKGTGSFTIFTASYTGADTIVRGSGVGFRPARGANSVATFTARLPIAANQYVGMWSRESARATGRMLSGADLDLWIPRPEAGKATKAGGVDQEYALAYNADVEPDADRDGYGDETQDKCPTSAATHDACPPPPPPPPPPDTTAPAFTAKPRIVRRRTAKLRIALSEPAQLSVVVQRRAGKRYKRVAAGSLAVVAGKTAVPVGRRLWDKRLRRGRHRLVLVATDAAGNASAPVRVRFRVR